jgi:hypothetical protein
LFPTRDCKNANHLWEPTTGGKWVVENKPFQGHFASVEDFQVGLPAQGKTFTAAKLTRYLRWLGDDTQHFNVGKVSSIEKQTDFQLSCHEPVSLKP